MSKYRVDDELPGRDRVEVEGLGDDIEFSEYASLLPALGQQASQDSIQPQPQQIEGQSGAHEAMAYPPDATVAGGQDANQQWVTPGGVGLYPTASTSNVRVWPSELVTSSASQAQSYPPDATATGGQGAERHQIEHTYGAVPWPSELVRFRGFPANPPDDPPTYQGKGKGRRYG
ncbi:hypothetical protein MMC10_004061 [Thelotrema lepadinum]|nr:hypothetical protein [Thelotrema lepadinum]